MNNKKLGSEFEKEFCQLLASRGYWVHFISPAPNGGQPFDIIAAKYGEAYAFDCKTSEKTVFSFSRLEENQIYAFEKWLACGNPMPMLVVKYKNEIHLIPYITLKTQERVKLNESTIYCKYGSLSDWDGHEYNAII